MNDLQRGGYSYEEVKSALHSPRRKLAFKYELYDKDNEFIKELDNVLSGSVSHNTFAQIKRTASFEMREDEDIDFLTHKIKPYVQVEMKDSKFVDFPLGLFHLSSPTRQEQNGEIVRDVEAFDGLVVLLNDKLSDRYFIAQGTSYKDAVVDLLESSGITQYIIEDTDKTLSTDVEFEAGKEKLFVINELLSQVNFTPIHVDVNGNYVSQKYQSPSNRTSEYLYKTDQHSVVFAEMSEELDIFSIPNKWVVTVSNSEEPPLTASFTNDDPNSRTSTVSRGQTIVDFRTIDKISDQQALTEYVRRIAHESSQIYGTVEFETLIMPQHDYADVFSIDFTDLGITGKYLEVSWELPLEVGGQMTHEIRKVVEI